MKTTRTNTTFGRLTILAIAGLLTTAIAIADTPLPINDGQVHEGVASCANSVCHGAIIAHTNSNIAHTEYTVWTRRWTKVWGMAQR